MPRRLTLVIGGVLLVGLFSAGGSVAPFTPGPDPVVSPSHATATPPPTTTPPSAYIEAGSSCTLQHAAETDITGVQPRITVNASIGSLGNDSSYDETIVQYHITFSRPATVSNLSVNPHGGDVTAMDGFMRSGMWFVAEGQTVSLTVRVRPRRARFGGAFAPPPTVAYRWTSGGDSHCTYTMDERTPLAMQTDPELNVSYAQGGVLLSPGQHEDRTFTADGTTVRLVYDATHSAPRFDPARAEAELTRVAHHFDVAAGTERVTVFALPVSASGRAMTWPGGPVRSSRTVTVSSARHIGTEGSVWIHEYVHTVQTFTVGERMRWFVEGSAEYYAHLLPYQLATRHDATKGCERATMLIRRVGHARDSVLTDPATWDGNTEYYQGAAAVLILDNRLRAAANGTYTMMDVFRWMNTYEGTVTYETFRRRLVRWGNDSIGKWVDTHVARRAAYTAAGVTMPVSGPVTCAEHVNPTARDSADEIEAVDRRKT